jgi:hypothetical protein
LSAISSNGTSLSFSLSTGATGAFEGVATSSAMTSFHLRQQKTKKVVQTMWYLHLEGVNAFLFNKLG